MLLSLSCLPHMLGVLLSKQAEIAHAGSFIFTLIGTPTSTRVSSFSGCLPLSKALGLLTTSRKDCSRLSLTRSGFIIIADSYDIAIAMTQLSTFFLASSVERTVLTSVAADRPSLIMEVAFCLCSCCRPTSPLAIYSLRSNQQFDINVMLVSQHRLHGIVPLIHTLAWHCRNSTAALSRWPGCCRPAYILRASCPSTQRSIIW